MKQLGLLVGASESTISLYETGKHEPDLATIARIADVLKVTVDELIGHQSIEDEEDMNEVMMIRERLRSDPEYRLLFKTARNANPDHLRAAAAMLKALEKHE